MDRSQVFFGRRARWLVGAMLLPFALWNARATGAESPDALAVHERAKAFQWFSSLDYPDVAKLPFILAKVPIEDYKWMHGRYPPRVVAGFLVADNAQEFTFFSLDRETRTLPKPAKNTPPNLRAEFARADMAEYVRFVADALAHDAAKQRDSGISPRLGVPPADGQQVFALAWACWRKGNESSADDLFNRAASLDRAQGWKGSAYNLVTGTIRQTELDRALYGVADEDLPRQKMLERCRRFVKLFPDSAGAAEVASDAKILARMVAEEKQHAADRAKGKPFDKLSKHDQIAELIFELRDQTGYQFDNCRQCNFFSSVRTLYEDDPDGNTPAHRLAKYGLDAVPQLVDALSDDRFCRAREVANHSFHEFNLTIGDCAERILSRILAHDFYPYYCMSHDGTAAKVRAAVNAWYTDVLRRGEKQVLIQMVENDGNYDAAAILAEKYPGDALEPIRIRLAKKADTSWWYPSKFIRAAAKIPGDSPIPFLRERATEGKTLDERLAAAVALVKRDHPDGVVALVHEWNTADSGDQMFYSLILTILQCGSPDAIGALADGMPSRTTEVRADVLDAIYRHDTVDALFGVKDGQAVTGKSTLPPEQLRAKQAVIALLIQSLSDTQQIKGAWTGESSDKWVSNVRLCDVAGRDLHRLDPKTFPFDLEAPLVEREKNRLAIIKSQK